MLYPRRHGHQRWRLWVPALGVGFATLSYALGSVVIGRFASPAGVLLALIAGAVYALVLYIFVIRRTVAHTHLHPRAARFSGFTRSPSSH